MMDIDQWSEEFVPVVNHLSDNASFDDGNGGVMFETYGEEIYYVLETMKEKPNNVWTYVDGKGGTYIISGFHYVNRIGYFITEKPFDKPTEVRVSTDDREFADNNR